MQSSAACCEQRPGVGVGYPGQLICVGALGDE